MKREYLNKDITTPNILNILIGIGSIAGLIALLAAMEMSSNLLVIFAVMFMFSFLSNTTFALLHEAVHSNFHSNKTINYIGGVILAAFFPTGFSFQKLCHLNHHRQNRTDYEMFEAYHENDSKPLKSFMLYSILTGLYWICPPLGALWLMIHPGSLLNSNVKNNYEVGRMGGAGMLRNFDGLPKSEITKMRLEILASVLIQAAIFYFLNLSFLSWILCYAAFAVNWSTLQYVDHAYSPRDVRHGAWNLKVSKFTQYMFLNYHHHLAHHQHPHVPWIHLGKFVNFDEPRPTFWKIYARMWKGLEKTEVEAPKINDPDLERLISMEPFLN